MDIKFTKEEISVIEKNLGFIVFDWAKHLINHIISQARNQSIKTVYMNTMETLDAGAIDDVKMEYFYKKLPPLLGFKKEEVTLRNNITEIMWAYHLDRDIKGNILKNLLIKIAKQFTLEELPSTYQGAFIGIIGRKPFYNEEEIKKVLNILEKRKDLGQKSKSPKAMAKFYYDWDSKTWSGAQRFRDDVTENVVLQKIPSEMQNYIQSIPALLKFWSFVLSQMQHFDPDTIGFALVSKVSSNVWVVNEIQTDVINAYMKLRRLDREESDSSNKPIDIDTLKDMLQAQNRSKWINKIEMNEAFANQLMNNPGMIQQLPDDTVDIDAWIEEQREGMEGQEVPQNLMQYFNSVNFNTRIFKV